MPRWHPSFIITSLRFVFIHSQYQRKCKEDNLLHARFSCFTLNRGMWTDVSTGTCNKIGVKLKWCPKTYRSGYVEIHTSWLNFSLICSIFVQCPCLIIEICHFQYCTIIHVYPGQRQGSKVPTTDFKVPCVIHISEGLTLVPSFDLILMNSL